MVSYVTLTNVEVSMFENNKINESEYFYQRIVDEQSNYLHFRYNLSAFLASTRSVLQYIWKEEKYISGRTSWYDKIVSESPILRYFKEKRDINIHAKPLKPIMNVTVYVSTARVLINSPETNSPDKGIFDVEENVVEENVIGKTSETIFIFNDWDGPENVLQLCRIYLNELIAVVQKGQIEGIITP
jgi:hypothetical protein